MGLSFLSPLFLLGLVATIVPILIHRLSQRRAVVRKFSAVRLLLLSHKQVTRPLRLKHLLLLALRILAVASLAFMLARPVLVRQEGRAGAGLAAAALIIDNSASMAYRTEAGERFLTAKKAAQAILQRLEPTTQLAVVAGVPVSSSGPARLTTPREGLAQVEKVPLSFGRGNYVRALTEAYEALRGVAGPKAIFLVTDLARGGWERFSLAQIQGLDGEVPIKVVRLAPEGQEDNLAVTQVETAGLAVVGVRAGMTAKVSNLGSRKMTNVSVEMVIKGKKTDQKVVSLDPGQEEAVSLEFQPEETGWLPGQVRIAGDALSGDNTFFFSIKAQEKIKVLVVDGEPGTTLRAGESFFLVNALNPERSAEEALIVPRVVAPTEMMEVPLNQHRAVFLLNVGNIGPDVANRLLQYVTGGGNLFLFVGDNVSIEQYNSALYDGEVRLLPGRFKQAADQAQKIGLVEYRHPALAVFERSQAGLSSVNIYRYLVLSRDGQGLAARPLITLTNGDPLLVETKIGAGRVLLFSSSADVDWNDLGLKVAYVPLMQNLVRYVAGLDKTPSFSSFVGQGPQFDWPPKVQGKVVRVIDPAGRETAVLAGQAGGLAPELSTLPGWYRVISGEGDLQYAINIPREESDLRKVTSRELARMMEPVSVQVAEYKEEKNLAGLFGSKRELWPVVLVFLLMILAVETLVAARLS